MAAKKSRKNTKQLKKARKIEKTLNLQVLPLDRPR
jgi:hypothetical protein